MQTTTEKFFMTPLGIVRCGLKSDVREPIFETRTYENGKSEIFKTISHKIELIEFKIRSSLSNGYYVTDSLGWIWRIEKITEANEPLEIYCLLNDQNNDVKFDIAGGEHLDAIEAANEDWILHIGTEDGEVQQGRAKDDDWFPSRLVNMVGFNKSITTMHESGFKTRIPELQANERLHIQYLTAYDKRDDKKVNTWLAVDESKRRLENWIGVW